MFDELLAEFKKKCEEAEKLKVENSYYRQKNMKHLNEGLSLRYSNFHGGDPMVQ